MQGDQLVSCVAMFAPTYSGICAWMVIFQHPWLCAVCERQCGWAAMRCTGGYAKHIEIPGSASGDSRTLVPQVPSTTHGTSTWCSSAATARLTAFVCSQLHIHSSNM